MSELNAKPTFVIWSNKDLDLEAYKKDLADSENEEMLLCSDRELYNAMWEENGIWLDDERRNLDIDIDTEIICIADIGLWDGRRSGYRLQGISNIGQCLCLSNSCEEGMFYVDPKTKDLCCTESHHDGTNFLRFRAFRKGISESKRESLFDAILNGKRDPDTMEMLIESTTKALGPTIAKAYGWKLSGQSKKTA